MRTLPRPRLSLRTMLVLIALCAIMIQVGAWVWRSYFSPTHRWLRTIQDDNGAGARFLVGAEAVLGKDPNISPSFAVTALIGALKSPHENVRADATANLGQGGAEALRAIPALIAALNDSSRWVRGGAVASLGRFASEHGDIREQLIPHLLKAMDDPAYNVRYVAADQLGRIIRSSDPIRSRVIEALAAQLEDPNTELRVQVCWALARLGRGDMTVPALVAALDDGRPIVRALAVQYLEDIGPEAELAIPAVAAMVRREQTSWIRKAAVKTLVWIGGPDAIEDLPEPPSPMIGP